MKKHFPAALVAILLLALTACGSFTDAALDVPAIPVESSSITAEGQLLTACAADKKTDPVGQNQSPALGWQAVDGAQSYVILMFDEDANWLHWLATGVTDTELAQGAYTGSDSYVGPYPPGVVGRHNYRIEVFALQQAPDAIEATMDARGSYADIVASIDIAGGEAGNILARGHVVGTYAHGDDTH